MIHAERALKPIMTRVLSAVDRREAWLWFLAMFALASIAIRTPGGSFSSFLTSVGEHNLIYWLCYAVIAKSIAGSATAPADRPTIAALFGGGATLLVFAILNVRQLDGIVATAAGLLLYLRYADDPGLRRAGVVFIAFGVNLFWAQAAFALLKEQIVVLDALLTGAMLQAAGYEVVRAVNAISANGDVFITIIGACSSFNNLSLAALAVVAAAIGARGDLRRQDIVSVVFVCLLAIAFNTIRLALFATSKLSYAYWHEGEGVQVLAVVQTVLILGAAAMTALWKRTEPA